MDTGGNKSRLAVTFSEPDVGSVKEKSNYVFSTIGTEARAQIPLWEEVKKTSRGRCVEIAGQDERAIEVVIEERRLSVSLTDADRLDELVGSGTVYIDISGLAHHVWAPLIRASLRCSAEVFAVYVEPKIYRSHRSPASTSVFDLSEGFRGLEPLPGFVNLSGPTSERDALFVPFLGFEGPRARQLAMSLDPVPHVIPVIGVPGFRIEYPQITISSNQEFLTDSGAHANVRFADAVCPFAAYNVIDEIRKDYPDSYLYLAPVGTKPHALGVVWYAIEHPSETEIMYDHPMRKPRRTEGIGAVHVYRIKP
jgi:hypothetical protein